jgi:hypothetical protein
MDAGTSDKSAQPAASARLTAGTRWFPVGIVAVSSVVVLALLRYAIDLLAPFCAMLPLARSIRDAFGDWRAGDAHEGEPDPAWAIGVIGVHLFGTAIGLLWIFSTSSWAMSTWLAEWIPVPVIATARFAEEHGWGRRAVLPGGPVSPSPAPTSAPRSVTVGATPRAADNGRPTSLAVPSASTRDTVAGTAGQAPAEPRTPQQAAGPISTSITLTSSASVLPVGSELQLTATVVASRERPSGSVVFRRSGVVMGSAALDANGQAVLKVRARALSRGTHTITAVFTGGAGFRESRSGPLLLFVAP